MSRGLSAIPDFPASLSTKTLVIETDQGNWTLHNHSNLSRSLELIPTKETRKEHAIHGLQDFKLHMVNDLELWKGTNLTALHCTFNFLFHFKLNSSSKWTLYCATKGVIYYHLKSWRHLVYILTLAQIKLLLVFILLKGRDSRKQIVIFKKITTSFNFKTCYPRELCSPVIYTFTCACCNACYIGKTGNHFFTRVHEHLSSDKYSHMSKHLLSSERCRQSCSADCFEILDSTPTKFQLKLKEAMHNCKLGKA